VKQDGEIIRNPSRPFLQDLDALPLADRELFQEQIFEPESRISVLLGRGCPYQCTYCCNHKIREVAGGRYVRMRSVPGIVEELESLTRRFPGVREYFLEVETLGAHMKWLEELCRGLEQFNRGRDQALSFSANLRVFDRMDHERIFSRLSRAGFDSVSIGLESGSERIRKEVLDRHYSNKTIRLAVHTARKHGLKVGMFNLIGLPTESFDDYLETLRLNQELQPDWHPPPFSFPTRAPACTPCQKSWD
jgi:anaerobic magnesium-protoporphyrin IX monomethyl ester cyclase